MLLKKTLHPLQPGAMRGDGTTGLKKQIPSSRFGVSAMRKESGGSARSQAET